MRRCPATIAIKRQFDIDASLDGKNIVNLNDIHLYSYKALGVIDKKWTIEDFENLRVGVEFHTEIELY